MPFKKEKNREQRSGRRKNGSGIVFLSLLFTLCFLLFAHCSLLFAETVRDRVVAYIDNTAITLSDLAEKYAETVKVLPDTTKEEVLTTMINRILLVKEANRIKMEIKLKEFLKRDYYLKNGVAIEAVETADADRFEAKLIAENQEYIRIDL